MTRVALESYPYPDRIKRIRIIAVTPAALIENTGANVMHFVSQRDLFPYLACGLRESLFDERSDVTVVDAPGDDKIPGTNQIRSAHDLHGKSYQEAIRTYLSKHC